MEAQSGRQQPETRLLLDIEVASARQAQRRYKRMYHRVMSGLERDGDVRFLTLTSSPEAGDFQKDFRKLIMRLSRRGLVTSYIRVPELTKSGLRHDHILFRGSYIERQFIAKLWGEIHNSPVVDIRRVRGRRGLACYMANYLVKSPAGRYSYSWGWVWKGFAQSWKRLKVFSREMGWSYQKLLTFWRICVKLDMKIEGVIPI